MAWFESHALREIRTLDPLRDHINTYWLSKGAGQAAEGPFTLAQIRAMLERDIIGADAMICPVEGSD